MRCVFVNDPTTTEIYTYRHTLSLHDTLPILPIYLVSPLLDRGHVKLHRYHAKLHDTSFTAPPQVPSLRFASGVPQGRRRAFGWHKSHPQAPPCVLRAGNRLLHPLIARRNFAVGTALCGNMRPYELGVSNP